MLTNDNLYFQNFGRQDKQINLSSHSVCVVEQKLKVYCEIIGT
jgi:hypothetical protein